MNRSRGWEYGKQIEVSRKGYLLSVRSNGHVGGLDLHHGADFIFDMTNFSVMKDRYATWDGTPKHACELLTEYLENPRSRILILTD